MNRRPLDRRAQGISVNMIILVAIGLIILVIAVLLVNRSGRSLSEGATTSCISQGGTCKASCATNDIDLENLYTGISASCTGAQGQAQKCCRYNFGGQ